MDRAEHLAWAKTRALEYLDRGDLQNAMASFTSDMGKHDETAVAMGVMGGVAIIKVLVTGDQAEARRFIEGFN